MRPTTLGEPYLRLLAVQPSTQRRAGLPAAQQAQRLQPCHAAASEVKSAAELFTEELQRQGLSAASSGDVPQMQEQITALREEVCLAFTC